MTSPHQDASTKTGIARRELTLYELVIPELVQMDGLVQTDGTPKFDRNVLLWLQDAYVSRAMKENTGDLLNFHRELQQTDTSQEERWRRKTEFLTKITRETYSTAKAEGTGFDLKQYVDAAKTFYESESVLYAGQLGEMAEFIKKSMAAGIKPDIERFAAECYVSMDRMSRAMMSLEKIGPRANAQQVAQMMKKGIDGINYAAVTTPGQPVSVGRELLNMVQRIGEAPKKYLQFIDPHKLGMPKAGPWDFERTSHADHSPSM
jgi:hypothetical protein